MSALTFYFVAGERSGDAHAAALAEELKRREPSIVIRGLGGPELAAAAGSGINDWVEEAGVVGLWEVLRKYPYFRRRFDEAVREIESFLPEAVVLVDYPGFNLRLARALRQRAVRTRIIYYISPQVWAWNRRRIPRMAEQLDLMLCIFPFEEELYRTSGLRTVFVGHPLTAELARARDPGLAREADLIGFFPGSRLREVEKHFPPMLGAMRLMREARPELRFVASAASVRMAGAMTSIRAAAGFSASDIPIETRTAKALMQRCAVGAVASGTATLQAAFFGLPYCLVYRVAWPTYLAGRALIRVPHLGIVNILAGREVVKELLQSDAAPEPIAAELVRLLSDDEARQRAQDDLRHVTEALGEGGSHVRAADAIFDLVDRGSSETSS